MKKGFVRLTLALCIIMLFAAPTAVFAGTAGSCGNWEKNNLQDYFGTEFGEKVVTIKGTSNYEGLYQKDCMKLLLKYFNLQDCTNVNWGSGGNADQDCANGNCGNTGNVNQDCTNDSCGNTGAGEAGNAGNTGNQQASVSSYAQEVADIVNEERNAAGLSSLTMNSDLCKVAQAKAEDMKNNGYFSHNSPTYGTPFQMMKAFGITYSAAGENIAKGQKSPESVMNAWMNSSGHRANILNTSYEKIGVGYTTDSNGTTYWVQMFIK